MSDEDSVSTIAASWVYRLLKLVGWLILLLATLVLFIFPATLTWLIGSGNAGASISRWMRSIESLQIALMHLITLGWIFAIGGCLASFLNVVAWRVPRGRPITGSSHCPACDGRLAFFDNLPVIGWLRNEGQCRQCHVTIPVRYLIAELVLGTIFLILGAVAFLSGGANWPLFEAPSMVGFEHLLFSPAWNLIGVLAWHLTLMCFLFTIMLIESEGLSVPRSILTVALAMVACVALLAPEVWLIQWWMLVCPAEATHLSAVAEVSAVAQESAGTNPAVQSSASALATAVMGGVIAWVVGQGMRLAVTRNRSEASALPWAMALVGMFLGWQASLAVGAFALVLCGVAKVFVRGTAARLLFVPTGCVLFATVVRLLTWKVFYC